jgi:hypothetical protein
MKGERSQGRLYIPKAYGAEKGTEINPRRKKQYSNQ